MKHKRTCSKCKSPIAKHHRWHTVYHKFLWFTWATQEHRDCQKPTEIHKRVVRLNGEVPLPFDIHPETNIGMSITPYSGWEDKGGYKL